MSSSENQSLTQQGIKALHLKQIYLHCLRSGGISRAQLRRRMGLSFPSVSALVDELLDWQILEETGVASGSSRGRPSVLLQVKADRFVIPVVMLDDDGYHCKLYDFAAQEQEDRFIPYDFDDASVLMVDGRRNPSVDAMVRPLARWISEIREWAKPLALVVSTPGSISDAGALSSSSIRLVTPDGFLSSLKNEIGAEVFVGNTSDHYAYAEYHCSGTSEDFALIQISHGVGASVMRGGRVFETRPRRAGEIGHISIDYRGRPCLCGGRGCLERYISTSALAEDAGMGYEALCERVLAQDPHSCAYIREKADILAVGISNMLTMQPLRQIVLGGQIRKMGEPFLNALCESVGRNGFRKNMQNLNLRYSVDMDDPEILGALWNFLENQFSMDPLLDQGAEQ